MASDFTPALAASLRVHPLEVATIVAAALRSVHDLFNAIDAAAEAGTVYADPWLMVSHLDHAIGEKDDIRSLAANVPGSRLFRLPLWAGASAMAIAHVIDGDAQGRFFKSVLDSAIILRARHAHGDGSGRLESFRAAFDDLQDITRSMAIDDLADPYAVLNLPNADLGLPENRGATELIEFANKVVNDLYLELENAADEGKVYEDGFVLMSFDKMTVGDAPDVGEIHFDASKAARVGAMMMFGRSISARDVLRAFLHEEMELRVFLVTALICLRQLRERGGNRAVEKQLDEQVAAIKARLWYGANAT